MWPFFLEVMHTCNIMWKSNLLSLYFDDIFMFIFKPHVWEEQLIWDIMKSKMSSLLFFHWQEKGKK